MPVVQYTQDPLAAAAMPPALLPSAAQWKVQQAINITAVIILEHTEVDFVMS